MGAEATTGGLRCHTGDRWVPVQPAPRASGLGFVPGPSPRGLYPTGAWHAEKKRESLKSCRPAGLYKDNWGPPGLAPELGIINKSPGSPPCPLVCLMLPGHGFTPRGKTPSAAPSGNPSSAFSLGSRSAPSDGGNVNRTTNRTVDRTTNRTVNRTTNRTVDRTTNQTVDRTTHRTVDRTTSRNRSACVVEKLFRTISESPRLPPGTGPLRLDRVRQTLSSRSGPVPGGGLGLSDLARNGFSTIRSVHSQRVVETLNSCSTTLAPLRVPRARNAQWRNCSARDSSPKPSTGVGARLDQSIGSKSL